MYLGEFQIGEAIAFNFQALDGYGQPVDADTLPTYEVYKDNAPMSPPVGGTMLKLNNQTGFYGATLQATLDAGFVGEASYTIRISAVIVGTPTMTTHTFQLASFIAPDNDRTLPEITPPTLSGDLSMYEKALLNTAVYFLTEFDSVEAVYQPYGKPARTIRALPLIKDNAPFAGAPGNAPTLTVMVINSDQSGISANELDLGKDTLRIATRVGGAQITRRIARIVDQDIAILTLEVR